MIKGIEIKTISVQQVYSIRHPVLRPNRPFSSCFFKNDIHPKTVHLGAFSDQQLVGVLSALPNLCSQIELQRGVQFRGMAVLKDHRNKGIGTLLIEELSSYMNAQGKWDYYWLNGRIQAISLYLRVGMIPLGAPFDIPKIGLHQCLYKIYNA